MVHILDHLYYGITLITMYLSVGGNIEEERLILEER